MRTIGAVAVPTAAIVLAAVSGRIGIAIAVLGLLLGGAAVLVLRRLSAVGAIGGRLQRIEQGLATADKERTAAATQVARIDTRLRALRNQINHDAINLQRTQLREVEGLVQLFSGFTPRAPMPSSGQWALNPTDLLALLHLVERRQPAVVVELGSGTSTVWMAYAVERFGGRIVSLDHDPEYAERTRVMLRAHGLGSVAEVRDAPLQRISVRGTEFDWYDTAMLSDVDAIDLLLVDGPPGSIGPLSRYPALDALRARLAPGATVVLDDFSREDEQETVRRWVLEESGLHLEPTLIGQHAVLSFARRTTPAQRTS